MFGSRLQLILLALAPVLEPATAHAEQASAESPETELASDDTRPTSSQLDPAASPPGPSPSTSVTAIHAYWTQFAGAAISGPGDGEFRYGGRIDAYVTVDGQDIGLWDGLAVNLHPEFVYGRNVSQSGSGILLPPSVAQNYPSNGGSDFDLSLYVTQKIGRASLTAGKINMLDLAQAVPLTSGGGQEGFQHAALAAPPSLVTPATIFGALVNLPVGKGPTVTLGIWDPTNMVNRSGFGSPFEKGVSGMVSLMVPLVAGGKLGIHTLSVQATSKRGLDLNDIPDIFLPPESEAVFGPKRGGLQVKYAVQQYLWADPEDSRRGWGLFGHLALWDDNPLPFRWSANLGFAGTPPIASRPLDRFGIGYFRVSVSPALRGGLAPLVDLDDEQGMEAFYTFQLGQFARLTTSVQYVDPFIHALDPSWFAGVRLRAGF